MRICAIGDAHGNLEKLKEIPLNDVDLILLTGDVGKADFARNRFFENIRRKKEGLEELEYSAKDNKTAWMEIFNSSLGVWKYTSKFAPTYSILGNVGMSMIYDSNVRKEEKKYGLKLPSLRQNMNKIKNFYFVRNRVRNFDGLRIGFLEYFSEICWYKEYNNKDKKKIVKAKKETEKAKRVLERFGKVDILVCHQLPYGFLDETNNPSAPKEWKGKHAGSKVILDYIKKYQPKYVFCGHIHEGEGKARIGRTDVYNLGEAGYKIIELD